MNRKDFDLDQLLDQAVAEIRDDAMAPEAERVAGDRVWETVRREGEQAASRQPKQLQIHSCDDFQALIPAYLQGALSDAKKLLFEDHVNECIPCRRVLKQARQARRPAAAAGSATGSGWVSRWGLRAAAAAVILFAVIGLSFNLGDVLKVRTGGIIRIDQVEGELFRVTPDGAVPVVVGEQVRFGDGEDLRTAKGSRAMLRLDDGSAVEMRERTELAVRDQAWLWNRSDKDGVIELSRGSVIVEASEQGSGNLFVQTDDSLTSVTGTVFAVNHGIKGTRVSVIEGEVHVRHTGATDVLLPGQQTTTQVELAHIPVEEEIAWSANYDRHVQMLSELTELGRELDETLRPELRYSTEMLDLAPRGTVVYVGIPNVTESLGEAHEVLRQRIEQSQALAAWWQENVTAAGMDDEIQEAVAKVQAYGQQLGDEIALTLRIDEQGELREPLVLARLDGREAFRALIDADLAKIGNVGTDGRPHVAVVEGREPDLGGVDARMYLWLGDNLMALSTSREEIQAIAAQFVQREQGLRGSSLYDKLESVYRHGTEFVVGVDMQTILGTNVTEATEAEMEGLGLLDMEHLVGERKTIDGRTENRVVLTFSRERRGLAGWLDEPAPMGALDFISPAATLAAGFVMEEPSTLVDELFETLGGIDSNFDQHLMDFQTEHGVDIRSDFVAPLGGEVAFALDGPLLPTPSWKLIVEVYDPAQLNRTLGWAVDQINDLAQSEGHKGLALTEEHAADRDWYCLESLDTGLAVHYVFVDGYLLAGPSRALLQGAIDTRDSGLGLTTSDGFRKMLPRDGQVNFSGVVYQNLGSLLGPLASLGQAAAKLSPEQAQLAQELGRNSRPSMTVAYGAPDRITFVYTHEGGFFSSALTSFFSFRSLMGVQQLVGESLQRG